MENIDKLSEIAAFINANDLLADLQRIKQRASQPNAELVFPLVGEFSAGKTTLINALTDSKKLETATKPTTTTIYEIHFGCDKCAATVFDAKGNKKEVADIADLKNDVLADAPLVVIYDSSKRIPSTTVLVDTPGLSSPNPKHKQTLVNFLPKADGILLVTDINSQVTRSLTDFIDTMKLSRRPIYLVLTKCDSKSAAEVEASKKYIAENCKLPLQQVACVSATGDDMGELYALLEKVQQDKNSILAQANKHRIEIIAKELQARIDELLKASNSESELDEAIRKQELELQRLKNAIDRLLENSRIDIEDCGRNISRKFEDMVSGKLNTLVAGKSSNFDAEAVGMINSTSSLYLSEYKSAVKDVLRRQAVSVKGTENELNLRSLADADMSDFAISGVSYNMSLNTAGHEYDAMISQAVTVVGTAVAVAATAGAAGAAAGGAAAAASATEGSAIAAGAATVGKKALSLETIFDVADTVTDVASMGGGSNNSKGMVQSVVGFFTDMTMGKPQRIRAVNNYLSGTLMPQFKSEIERLSSRLLAMVSDALHQEADGTVLQMTDALRTLKQERKDKADAFKQRMDQLKDFKQTLNTL